MLGQVKTAVKMLLLIHSAVGLPFELYDDKSESDAGMDDVTEVSYEEVPYDPSFTEYDPEVEREYSSISFDGNAEEALLKVLGEKDNTINVNIGELFDNLLANQVSEKTSITPAVFISTFLSSLTGESMVILLLTPFIFLFLTSISAMVAVPTLLLGLSLASQGNIPALERLSAFENFDAIPEPIALPNLQNIADNDYGNADGSAPRLWKNSS